MSRNKKLLIIIPYFIPAYGYGWPLKVAYDQARVLLQQWYDVTVLTTDALDHQHRVQKLEEVIDGIKIFRCKNVFNQLAKFHNAYWPPAMKGWLKRNIKNYDIVHIHDILNLPAVWWSRYAQKNNIPYFLHPHGTLSDVRINSRKSFIKKMFLQLFSSMLHAAAGIFALTAVEKDDIQAYTDNKHIHILPNGIDINEFMDLPTIDVRQLYWLDKDTTIFSFLGRIQYIKWLDIAFALLAEYNKTNTNRRYLIIWPDEWEQAALQSLAKTLHIEKNIIWHGLSTWKEKYALLQASDVFLFTSRAEGFPMTILEALWCWLPVCISVWCNLPEVDGVVWKVIDIHDVHLHQLTSCLTQLQDYRQGIPKFLATYSLKSLVLNLMNIYELQK